MSSLLQLPQEVSFFYFFFFNFHSHLIPKKQLSGHIGFPEGILPIGQVKNFADRVTEQFLAALLAMSEKISKSAQPAPRAPVEVLTDADLKRETASQVWLWDAQSQKLQKEKERVEEK